MRRSLLSEIAVRRHRILVVAPEFTAADDQQGGSFEAGRQAGLPVVTEVMAVDQVPRMAASADILQRDLAFAYEAVANDVSILLNHDVSGCQVGADLTTITTASGVQLRTRFVVNAAGLRGDELHRSLGLDGFTIRPRRERSSGVDAEGTDRPDEPVQASPNAVPEIAANA